MNDRLILLVAAGSRSYGLHHPTSDLDLKGVCFASRSNMLGFSRPFAQLQGDDVCSLFYAVCTRDRLRSTGKEHGVEGVVYELRKFFRLAAECNPNVLESLFCADHHVAYASPVGDALRDGATRFLSGKAKHTFVGYAKAQLARIRSHRAWLLDPPAAAPTREAFGLPDKLLLPKNHQQELDALVQKRLDSWQPDLAELEPARRATIERQLAATLQDAFGDDPWASAARLVGLNDDIIGVMQRERQYKRARANWKQFSRWKAERNPERAALEAEHGYDTKHGMHLMRLLTMGREILERGELRVDRTNIDAEFLRSVRAGQVPYEQLVEEADALLAAVDEAYATRYVRRQLPPAVPLEPDIDDLNAWCESILFEHLCQV